ncbi:MAG: GAF and ANTAR domain-containing protein, partial [Sciscionella sp.]
MCASNWANEGKRQHGVARAKNSVKDDAASNVGYDVKDGTNRDQDDGASSSPRWQAALSPGPGVDKWVGQDAGVDMQPAKEPSGAQAQRLAETMAKVAVELAGQPEPHDTIQRIVGMAAVTVPGADDAGVSLVEGSQITSDAPTNEIAAKLDALQVELDQGPCLSALRHEHTVQIDDMKSETRWPRFAARAAELGVHAALSFQLYVRDDALGALNLYAHRPHAFGQESHVIGHLFAQHAAVAYTEAIRHHHLGEALTNRDLIGQAKGILMNRERVDGER